MAAMSNLGLYQLMTTAAKRVGGPIGLAASILAIGIGAGTGIGFMVGRKSAEREFKDQPAPEATELPVFTVTAEGSSGDLTIHVGDQFRVLERDGDAVLIEVLGNSNNPYFVSAALLEAISDFPASSDPTDEGPSPS